MAAFFMRGVGGERDKDPFFLKATLMLILTMNHWMPQVARMEEELAAGWQ